VAHLRAGRDAATVNHRSDGRSVTTVSDEPPPSEPSGRQFTVLVHPDFLGRWTFEVTGVPGSRTKVRRLSEVRPRAVAIVAAATGLEPGDVHVVIRYRDPTTY
jgi:hypothetical protein